MLQTLLDKVQDLKNQLDAFRPLTPEIEARVMQKLRIDWNYHSNNIEGNSLTYGETRALLLYGITAKAKPLNDHRQVSGHQEAIQWLEDVIQQKKDLSEHFIRSLHELILEKPYQVDAQTPDGKHTKRWIEIGKYKETPNHVKTKTGEIFYFATPEETPAKMHDLLERYSKNAAKADVNPILLAAAFHHEFVCIHPFDDGNGRMSRLLMNFILMRFGYPPAVVKTDEKEDYFTALQLSDAEQNSEPLAEYLAQAVIHSLELMLKGARGESIEEADDLDKQLALLDLQLKNINHKTRTLEVLQNFAEEKLPVIFTKLFDISEKYRKYYQSQNAFSIFQVYQLENYLSQFEYENPIINCNRGEIADYDNFIKKLKTGFLEFSEKYYNSGIDYSLRLITYIHYKLFEQYQFSYNTGIYLAFDIQKYYIKNFKSDNQITKSYNDILTEDELNAFFQQIGQAHFDYIQEQIKNQK